MKKKNNELIGINIYRNKNNQNIYYYFLNKKAYIIKPEAEFSFKRFQSRLIIPILVFVFTYILFNLHLILSLVIALASLILIEYRFYRFLNNCVVINNFNPKKYIASYDAVKIKNSKFNFLRLFVYLGISILLTVNAFMVEKVANDIILKTLNLSLALASLFFFIKLLITIILKKSS